MTTQLTQYGWPHALDAIAVINETTGKPALIRIKKYREMDRQYPGSGWDTLADEVINNHEDS